LQGGNGFEQLSFQSLWRRVAVEAVSDCDAEDTSPVGCKDSGGGPSDAVRVKGKIAGDALVPGSLDMEAGSVGGKSFPAAIADIGATAFVHRGERCKSVTEHCNGIEFTLPLAKKTGAGENPNFAVRMLLTIQHEPLFGLDKPLDGGVGE